MLDKVVKFLEEIRKWLILFLVLFLVGGICFITFKSCEKDKEIVEKDKRIKELIKQLEEKPEVEIKYVEKVKWKDKVVYKEKPASVATKDLFSEYCSSCVKEGVVPLMVIESKGIRCQANICNPNDENKKVEITQQGEDVIENLVDNSKKDNFISHKILAGYEFLGSKFSMGYSFIDYKGLFPMVNVNTNFKNFDETEVGLAGCYQPRFGRDFRWKTNFAGCLGVQSNILDFQQVGLEGMLMMNILEKEKR